MSLVDFLRLVRRRIVLLILVPVMMTVGVLVATLGQDRRYESSTTVYTGLVSGYRIQSTGDQRLDYHAISSSFDNLTELVRSRSTVQEVALRLIARQVAITGRLPDAESNFVPAAPNATTVPALPDTLGPDYIATGGNGAADSVPAEYRIDAADPGSPLYDLLHRQKGSYSVETIREYLQASRIGLSDLLVIRYTTGDPDLARETLETLLDVVIAQYRDLKTRETGDVVGYFERETEAAQRRLGAAVERMRRFGIDNRVINYYEQTKAIANQKEDIDAELERERMRLAASEATQAEVERQISDKERVLLQSESVLAKRQQLATLASRRVIAEATGAGDGRAGIEESEVRASLTADIADLYSITHTEKGLARADLVSSWLTSLVDATEARARVALLEGRQSRYEKVYDVFSPLGSTLSSLEREVDTAESAYLELLHSLNLSRMRQQDVALSSRLDVIDAPRHPEDALPSKRMLLMILALLAGVMMTLGAVLAVELMDQSLRSPDRAEKTTGLHLAGALPDEADDTEHLADAMADRMAHSVLLELEQSGDPVKRILVAAPEEGAADVAAKFKAAITRAGVQGCEVIGIEQVLSDVAGLVAAREAGACLYVVNAGHRWSAADRRVTRLIEAAMGRAPMLVLRGVSSYRLEDIVGEIPRERHPLRRRVKRMARMEWSQ